MLVAIISATGAVLAAAIGAFGTLLLSRTGIRALRAEIELLNDTPSATPGRRHLEKAVEESLRRHADRKGLRTRQVRALAVALVVVSVVTLGAIIVRNLHSESLNTFDIVFTIVALVGIFVGVATYVVERLR